MLPSISLQSFLTMAMISGTRESYIALGLLVFFLLLVAYLIIRLFFKHPAIILSSERVTDEGLIVTLLHDAIDQRRPFEIEVPMQGGSRRHTIRSVAIEVTPQGLTLEISNLKELSKTWKGKYLKVFFRLRVNKTELSFFTFVAQVLSIYPSKENTCHITFLIPNELNNKQKRSFLRVEPPHHALYGAAIWYGKSMPQTDDFNDLSLWPNPLLFIIQGELSQFDIKNISAGGIRIGLSNKILDQYAINPSTVDHFILMLDLIDPVTKNLLRVWLHCKIQSIVVATEKPEIVIGAQFLSWGKPLNAEAKKGSNIEWLKTPSSQEVEALSNWVMRQHMESIRFNALPH